MPDRLETPQAFRVPIPDPTVLTTVQLRQAIEALKDLSEAKIEAVEKLLNARIDHNFAMDEKRHRETREWLQQMKDNRLERQSANDTALHAAFAAQKELVNQQRECNEEAQDKLEQSLNKQLESIQREAKQTHLSLDEKINTLKSDMDKRSGRQEEHTDSKGTMQWVVGLIVAVILSLVGNAITLVYLFTHTTK